MGDGKGVECGRWGWERGGVGVWMGKGVEGGLEEGEGGKLGPRRPPKELGVGGGGCRSRPRPATTIAIGVEGEGGVGGMDYNDHCRGSATMTSERRAWEAATTTTDGGRVVRRGVGEGEGRGGEETTTATIAVGVGFIIIFLGGGGGGWGGMTTS